MIKTINLIANTEQAIKTTGGTHVKIKNLGEDTIYVSRNSGIEIGGDGVKSIQGGSADILVNVATYKIIENSADYFGTFYALSSADCQIEIETTNNSNFRQIVKGGDNGMQSIVNNKNVVCLLDNNVNTFIGNYALEE